MKNVRAHRIAASFSTSPSFRVRPFHHGLLVRYRNQTCYFVRESCFWAFVYRVASLGEAGLSH